MPDDDDEVSLSTGAERDMERDRIEYLRDSRQRLGDMYVSLDSIADDAKGYLPKETADEIRGMQRRVRHLRKELKSEQEESERRLQKMESEVKDAG